MKLTTVIACLGLFMAAPALAECTISGDIAAEMVNDPDLGTYCYTLTVNWDTGGPHGLSHLDLLVDFEGGTCECEDFLNSISFPAIAGESDGEPGYCVVEYEGWIECDGDPSIPGVEGILFKYEPIEEDCEPGPIGTGYFKFYSNLEPVPVDESLPLVIEKASGESCEGLITGVFPGLSCDPVSAEVTSWTHLKGLFAR